MLLSLSKYLLEAKAAVSDKFIGHGKALPTNAIKGTVIMYNVVGASEENLEAKLVPFKFIGGAHITTNRINPQHFKKPNPINKVENFQFQC